MRAHAAAPTDAATAAAAAAAAAATDAVGALGALPRSVVKGACRRPKGGRGGSRGGEHGGRRGYCRCLHCLAAEGGRLSIYVVVFVPRRRALLAGWAPHSDGRLAPRGDHGDARSAGAGARRYQVPQQPEYG